MSDEPPKRAWIICGYCGRVYQFVEVGEAVKHAQGHIRLPEEMLPDVPAGRC